MQNTVDILSSHRSCYQGLTICVARFLVDLYIFSIASRTQKSSYPLAIPCRFVDFSTQKSTYPYAKHCRYSSLSQKLLVGADYMYSAIPCRFVDFLNSIQNQKIFLSIGNSLQICRFFKYVQKSTYPFAKHCSFSHL